MQDLGPQQPSPSAPREELVLQTTIHANVVVSPVNIQLHLKHVTARFGPQAPFMSGTRLMHHHEHEPWVSRIGLEPVSRHVLSQWYSDPWSHWEGPEFQKIMSLKTSTALYPSVQGQRKWWAMRRWAGVVVLKLLLILSPWVSLNEPCSSTLNAWAVWYLAFVNYIFTLNQQMSSLPWIFLVK